jgi:hypothetical protein
LKNTNIREPHELVVDREYYMQFPCAVSPNILSIECNRVFRAGFNHFMNNRFDVDITNYIFALRQKFNAKIKLDELFILNIVVKGEIKTYIVRLITENTDIDYMNLVNEDGREEIVLTSQFLTDKVPYRDVWVIERSMKYKPSQHMEHFCLGTSEADAVPCIISIYNIFKNTTFYDMFYQNITIRNAKKHCLKNINNEVLKRKRARIIRQIPYIPHATTRKYKKAILEELALLPPLSDIFPGGEEYHKIYRRFSAAAAAAEI